MSVVLTPDDVKGLVRTIEAADMCTAAHTWRVVLYTRAMAEHFGVRDERLERMTIGAALHDLGKLDVPTEILQKPGKLTDAEFAVIKTHPVRGHERLVALGERDELVLGVVRHHHERVDGLGYPDGLASAEIRPAARYFAVIDSFDAMTSLRPYRQDVGPAAAERAMEELHAGIGTRYDGECVSALGDLYRAGELKWILEYFNDATCELPFCPVEAGRARRQ